MLPERADPSTEVFPLREPSGATPSGAAPLPSWPVRGRQGWFRIDPGPPVAASLLPRDSDEVPLDCSFGSVIAVEGVDGVG